VDSKFTHNSKDYQEDKDHLSLPINSPNHTLALTLHINRLHTKGPKLSVCITKVIGIDMIRPLKVPVTFLSTLLAKITSLSSLSPYNYIFISTDKASKKVLPGIIYSLLITRRAVSITSLCLKVL